MDALGREIGFRLIPKLGDRDYDCAGLTALINDIKAHAANAPRDDRGMPLPFFNEVLEVYFDAVDDDEIRMEYLDPDSPEDIERYALGPRDGKAVLDKDGKPMVPMVDRCRRKGADYLMCQVGFVESAEEAAKACFPEATRLSSMEYETTDSRLSGLKGILFFRTTFDWCIVHNKVTVDCESPQPW